MSDWLAQSLLTIGWAAGVGLVGAALFALARTYR